MSTCPDGRENLLLDLFGELDRIGRPEWERHLETCPACRVERERLDRMLKRVRKAESPAELSPRRAAILMESITEKIEAKGRKFPLVPAAAAACLLAMVLVFGLVLHRDPGPGGPATATLDGQALPAKDLEVIRNLELLQEMDSLKRLVQAVDDAESQDSRSSERRGNGQAYG